MEQQFLESITLNAQEIQQINQLLRTMAGDWAIPLFNILQTAASRNQPNDQVLNNNSDIQQAGGDSETLPK